MEMEQLLGFMVSFLLVFAIIGLILYLVDAIATFKYLKVRGYANAWMAFIPFCNTYATVEATYGNVEKIKLFGIELPAIVVKLYPVILAAVSGVATYIPKISGALTTIVSVLTIAVGVAIFIDVMERLSDEVSVGFAILANIITIIVPIKILTTCNKLQPGQFDYHTDMRVLKSQMTSGQ